MCFYNLSASLIFRNNEKNSVDSPAPRFVRMTYLGGSTLSYEQWMQQISNQLQLLIVTSTETNERVQRLEVEMVKTNEPVQRLENRLDQTNETVQRLESKVDNIEQNRSTVDERLTKFEERQEAIFEQTAILTEFYEEAMTKFELLATRRDLEYMDIRINKLDREFYKWRNLV